METGSCHEAQVSLKLLVILLSQSSQSLLVWFVVVFFYDVYLIEQVHFSARQNDNIFYNSTLSDKCVYNSEHITKWKKKSILL